MRLCIVQDWMVENSFIDEKTDEDLGVKTKPEWWMLKPVSSLKMRAPFTVSPAVTCNQCTRLMEKHVSICSLHLAVS